MKPPFRVHDNKLFVSVDEVLRLLTVMQKATTPGSIVWRTLDEVIKAFGTMNKEIDEHRHN